MKDCLALTAENLLERYRDYNPGGFTQTDCHGVDFFWTDKPSPREPLSYDPGLAIILSGKKIGHLDGRRFEYGEGSYLVVGLPLIFECETQASVEEPLFGLFLRFRPEELLELKELLERDKIHRLHSSSSLGVEPLLIKTSMKDAIARLVRQLCQPHEAIALGSATLREIFFYALQDTHGRVLVSLTQMNRPEARIARLLAHVEGQGNHIFSVNDLAKDAGMSPASLHRHFKNVTGYSPVQYFKRRKLMRAKQLLSAEHTSVSQAAYNVGYSSAAQFSRDFKAMFGCAPSQI